MSYIEKEKLIKADIESIENRVRHAFNQGYDLGYKEGKERAKSQKSIFDKVYAEIEELQRDMLYASKVEFNDIYKIIDKYKTESEQV
jgi:flagellar biosynthesis/type III secretory pathway protein FliH